MNKTLSKKLCDFYKDIYRISNKQILIKQSVKSYNNYFSLS